MPTPTTDPFTEALEFALSQINGEQNAIAGSPMEPSPRDALLACAQLLTVEEAKVLNLSRCGSVCLPDPAEALYRVLWLFRPPAVDFSDAYKSLLFAMASPDRRFMAYVTLWKGWLGLFFYCPAECIVGPGTAIVGNWPGADNGVECTDPAGKMFFQLLENALSYSWRMGEVTI